MASGDVLLDIHSVSRSFGDVRALDDVSLQIRENEFFALLGPSGCGKTTLLRVIAGFEQPDSGTVTLDGQDLLPIPPEKRAVNLMFQSYALFPHMTVERNVGYGLVCDKVPRDEIRTRVGEVLATVGLTDKRDALPKTLSGGQRQRVALARAIVKRPRLLLLDEPLSALDRKIRGEMQMELKRLQHEVGITFVVVTHDQDEAMELADRVVVLNQGRIEQIGTPAELYDKPASPFVISFVGEAVALPVTVTDGHVNFAGRELHIDTHGLRSGPARVFFRPADIAVATGGDAELEGRVESLRRTPAGFRATIAIDGFDQTLEIESPVEKAATLGDKVPLSLNKARIFPADTIGFDHIADGI